MYYMEYQSPLGTLLLTCDDAALTGLWMNVPSPGEGIEKPEHPLLHSAGRWLDSYFRGEEQIVDLPLRPAGTLFQKQVWEILLTIPYGSVRTYGDIARQMAAILGKDTMSAQAVGQAVGRNPISIFIPCHRVVGTGGKLTGYAGGLDRKQWLLHHEGWVKESLHRTGGKL